MKVIGIGLNRTGTKTLGACLKTFGLHHLDWSPTSFNLYMKHGFNGLIETIEQYDSFEDWPWPLVYHEIDRAYPESKFILTKRESTGHWYESLCKHSLRTGPNNMRKELFGFSMPQKHEQEHIKIYEQHIVDVRAYFKGRPDDIIEVCWESGDGWHELSSFLNLELPEIPFPHKNKSSS